VGWRLQRTIAGKEDQISPRDLAAVLLLDGPQKATSLVETDVVGPAVEGSETLLSATVKKQSQWMKIHEKLYQTYPPPPRPSWTR
jgi:hypothetical protein